MTDLGIALPPEDEVIALSKAIDTHFGPHDERCVRNILDAIRPMIVEAEQARIARIFEHTGAKIEVPRESEPGICDEVAFIDLIAPNPPKPGTEPAKPEGPCEGFRWMGQQMSVCDRCTMPFWEHAHEERIAGIPGSVFGPPDTVLVPITPEQAKACRLRWGASGA